jgi:pSer/pThr/pTyr-binding forkhead associated (FHA) protein
MPTVAAETTLFLLRVAFLAVLYLFLGAVLIVVWRDMRAAEEEAAAPEQVHALGYLQVTNPGTTTYVRGDLMPMQPVTAIGRDLGNDIVLTDAFASAHHALLTYREGRWWLEDLGSSNGTTVNGSRIQRPTPLDPGDLIGIGQVVLKLL